jgi:hypothetical protein
MNQIVTRRMIALAALIASTLMAGCGLRSPNPSTETLNVYQDAPAMNPLDLGPPGNSPGDAYYFSAPLHSSIGEVFGSKTLIKLPGHQIKLVGTARDASHFHFWRQS